ncbi:SCP-2 sterol transfer family protein [Thelonectria olida]|uniref:SCP-2 sterol transfer family protein n=1 Tax=Thelonectria olida TaxID=1576542 RepID=A0A9P8VPR1_9HYPO|nr:SCP-2 sterol transfer family protein [Thelonectria olida]
MSLKNPKFPSSVIFDTIQHELSSSEVYRNNAIKQASAIFAIVLTNAAGETDVWHIDLKETGKVGKGPGNNPTAVLLLSETEFGDMVANKVNAQKLFMDGKLKIKGDVMKATKVEHILKSAQSKPSL